VVLGVRVPEPQLGSPLACVEAFVSVADEVTFSCDIDEQYRSTDRGTDVLIDANRGFAQSTPSRF
jgi:hypothetical protein